MPCQKPLDICPSFCMSKCFWSKYDEALRREVTKGAENITHLFIGLPLSLFATVKVLPSSSVGYCAALHGDGSERRRGRPHCGENTCRYARKKGECRGKKDLAKFLSLSCVMLLVSKALFRRKSIIRFSGKKIWDTFWRSKFSLGNIFTA